MKYLTLEATNRLNDQKSTIQFVKIPKLEKNLYSTLTKDSRMTGFVIVKKQLIFKLFAI